MNQFILLIIGIVALGMGAILGYYARQSIATKDYRTIEAKLQKKISEAKQNSEKIIVQAKEKASQIFEKTQKETDTRRQGLFKTERFLLKREISLFNLSTISFELLKNTFLGFLPFSSYINATNKTPLKLV